MIIKFSFLLITLLSPFNVAHAQSNLLESVKRNPDEALSLCLYFKDLNSRGVSASSNESLLRISQKRNLSKIDAEILSMYVRGLYCPNVI